MTRIGQPDVEETDRVALEEPLQLVVDGHPVAVLMRTPGNDEELANMLGKTGIQNFDIHGEDPVDYAKNQGLDHIIPVLQHYGVKPLEAKLKMHNAEFYQLIERAQQLKLSPGQILKLFNHFSEPAIARALSAKAKRAKDEDCDKILQLSPKQQREYDKLTASCVGPALALKSVARIR